MAVSFDRILSDDDCHDGAFNPSVIEWFDRPAGRVDLLPYGTHVLTPGRQVGAEILEDCGVRFAGKMEGFTREFATRFHESKKQQSAIRARLQKLDCALPEVGSESRRFGKSKKGTQRRNNFKLPTVSLRLSVFALKNLAWRSDGSVAVARGETMNEWEHLPPA